MKFDVLDILAQDNYIPYNKSLAKILGVETAILFGAFCGYQRYYETEWFYRPQKQIMQDTCLTEYAVKQGVKTLVEFKLLAVIKKGLPGVNHYRVNTEMVLEIITDYGNKSIKSRQNENISTSQDENTFTSECENISTTQCENTRSRECENALTNNKIYNNKINTIKIENKNNNINNINTVVFGLEEKEIFDFWNSKKIIEHRNLTDDIIKAIRSCKKVNKLTTEDIKIAIDRYATMLNDTSYKLCSYRWSLVKFLKQSNAITEFLDNGSKWVNYQQGDSRTQMINRLMEEFANEDKQARSIFDVDDFR